LKQYNIREKTFEKKKTVIEARRENAKIKENELYENCVVKLQVSNARVKYIIDVNEASYLIYLKKNDM